MFQYPSLPAYQISDQAFINEWNAAIAMYGEIFSGVTLVGPMTADGLPKHQRTKSCSHRSDSPVCGSARVLVTAQ